VKKKGDKLGFGTHENFREDRKQMKNNVKMNSEPSGPTTYWLYLKFILGLTWY
jgi:hypothetical protein